MKVKDLVGTWRLIALEARTSDGSISYPLGRDAQGFLMYAPDGYMSAVMCRANRNRFGTQDILAGTDAQLVDAARAYISYTGRYEIRDGRILHHVEASLFPDWVGTTQERIPEFDNGRLSLGTDPIPLGGMDVHVRVVWERPETP